MAWTTPTAMATYDVFGSSRWNAQVKDNLLMLASLANDGTFAWDNTNKRLGVGTASPAEKLHVQSATDSVAMIETTNAANYAYFRLKTTTRRYQFAVAGNSAFNPNNFYIYEEVAGATRLMITSTGSVLVGKTSGLTGAGDLDVNGDAKAASFQTGAGAKWTFGTVTLGAVSAAGYATVTINGGTYKLMVAS